QRCSQVVKTLPSECLSLKQTLKPMKMNVHKPAAGKQPGFLKWLNALYHRGNDVYGSTFDINQYPKKMVRKLYAYITGDTDMITFTGLDPAKGILLTRVPIESKLLYLVKPYFPAVKQYHFMNIQEIRSMAMRGLLPTPDPFTTRVYCLDGLGTETGLHLPNADREYFKDVLIQRHANRLLTHAASGMTIHDLEKKYGKIIEKLFNV